MTNRRSVPTNGRQAQPLAVSPRRTRRALRARLLAGLSLILPALSGCEVGPNYEPPAQHMPAAWFSTPTTQPAVQAPVEVERWWTTFNDPELNSLVRRAVVSNLDVRIAQERILEARASLVITTARFFPTANASGAYQRSYSNAGASATFHPRARDQWQDGLDAAWELDLFGGVRRSIEAGSATVEAAVWDRRDALVTLLGDVATDYFMLRGFQQEVAIADENLQSQIHNAQVARKKVLGGTTTELDVANADAQVASTRSSMATFEAEEQQAIHALSVLLAQEPRALASELLPHQKIPRTPPLVPVGIPSELLRRRPDVRRAERNLAAATANIGVAVAQLFPRFSLTGNLSLGGSRYQDLTSWGTRFWSFGPAFTWPIFDAGALWANVQVQNSVQRQALLSYRRTVLTALQDVENALIAYSQEQQRRAALAQAVAANQRAVFLATQRYQTGFTDFLNVLVAQGSLYSSQDALVQSDRAVGTDLVAIYKALGGGWEVGEPSTTRPNGG